MILNRNQRSLLKSFMAFLADERVDPTMCQDEEGLITEFQGLLDADGQYQPGDSFATPLPKRMLVSTAKR